MLDTRASSDSFDLLHYTLNSFVDSCVPNSVVLDEFRHLVWRLT